MDGAPWLCFTPCRRARSRHIADAVPTAARVTWRMANGPCTRRPVPFASFAEVSGLEHATVVDHNGAWRRDAANVSTSSVKQRRYGPGLDARARPDVPSGRATVSCPEWQYQHRRRQPFVDDPGSAKGGGMVGRAIPRTCLNRTAVTHSVSGSSDRALPRVRNRDCPGLCCCAPWWKHEPRLSILKCICIR